MIVVDLKFSKIKTDDSLSECFHTQLWEQIPQKKESFEGHDGEYTMTVFIICITIPLNSHYLSRDVLYAIKKAKYEICMKYCIKGTRFCISIIIHD